MHPARGLYGAVHICGIGQRMFGQLFTGGRIGHVNAPSPAIDPSTTNIV
jgi:hypothetical protein